MDEQNWESTKPRAKRKNNEPSQRDAESQLLIDEQGTAQAYRHFVTMKQADQLGRGVELD